MSERKDSKASDDDDRTTRQPDGPSSPDADSEPDDLERRNAASMEAAIRRTLVNWRKRKRKREALRAWVKQTQRRCVRVALQMPRRHAGPGSGGGALHD